MKIADINSNKLSEGLGRCPKSLSDKERMDAIDDIYTKMLDYRNLTKYYTQKSISVSYIRAKEKGDTDRVLSLYGSPAERYW